MVIIDHTHLDRCIGMSENVVEVVERSKDCLSCKIIGVGTFSGIGTYGAYLFYHTPSSNRQNRIFYAMFSLGAFTAAIFRAMDQH